jgi:dTDP-4-amino-4,6-dideoxy-D-galactose acyltransferase
MEFLNWDSNFFDKKIFRVDIDTATMPVTAYEEIVANLKQQKADGAYLFLSSQDVAWSEKLKTWGHYCVDEKVIFQKELNVAQRPSAQQQVVEYKGEVNRELIDLSLLAGKYSRFKSDLHINNKFETFYTEWMINSLNGQLADAVLVYKSNGKISGMLTFKISNSTAVIGLIAVLDEVQGKGIGKLLIEEMESRLLNIGINTVEVSTQLINTQACRFYIKAGFKELSVTPIFHLWF